MKRCPRLCRGCATPLAAGDKRALAYSIQAAAIDVHSMRWPSRRLERRADVTRSLLQAHPPLPHALYHSCNDLSKGEEEEGGVLEGTGSLVLDRVGKRAFVARSQRSGAAAAEAWAALHGCCS